MTLSKTARTRQLKALRRLIETDPDLVTVRIAYAIEVAVRYVTEETVSWPTLVRLAQDEARWLKEQLRKRA